MKQTAREWKNTLIDQGRVSILSEETGIPAPVVCVLVAKGIDTAETIERFLNPRLSDLSDPFLIPGMRQACDRIWQAIDQKHNIVIHGDFDADGVTSTTLMVKVLRQLGGKVTAFLPHRINDGYGLSQKGLERCFNGKQVNLLITVDCGTNAQTALKYAAARGVDVVVTDHHEVSGITEPVAAFVNPKTINNPSVQALAGVGVAFKVCHALVKAGLACTRPAVSGIDLRDYLDIVAAGTVADVVPLLEENRILVRHGLSRINSKPNYGLRALIEVAGINGVIDCYHLGFAIGPRLNAAGRMGSADPALELLLSDDHDQVLKIASELDLMNRERKKAEEVVVQECVKLIDPFFDETKTFGIVVGQQDWHIGIIGIVAAGLCGKYRRPVVVIGFDEEGNGRGSGRSTESMDIVDVLKDCKDLLVSFGGHRMAAGLSIKKNCYEDFCLRFNQLCMAKLKDLDLSRVYHVDTWVDFREVDYKLLEYVNKLKPFGLSNPAPVFGTKCVDIIGSPKKIANKHLKMTLASGGTQFEAIAFEMGDRAPPSGSIDVLFSLQENTYMGRNSLQLNIKDFRAAEKSKIYPD
ncbi:MAG: single-stranded-DNA-specific exonuclease RecJ [Lentisphaerae bacterium RIFOXYA12_FULL_48_11]|nr:MAG: single-stranded-DNA-specific exonuclease RecJ [Lentisphaerae bacterium RIFOXYA12_FULL_48_11]